MDECQLWELNDHIDNLKYFQRSEWEQTRLMMYATVQSQCGKKLDMKKDIMEFPWEKGMEKKELSVTKADIDYLTSLAKKQQEEMRKEAKQ